MTDDDWDYDKCEEHATYRPCRHCAADEESLERFVSTSKPSARSGHMSRFGKVVEGHLLFLLWCVAVAALAVSVLTAFMVTSGDTYHVTPGREPETRFVASEYDWCWFTFRRDGTCAAYMPDNPDGSTNTLTSHDCVDAEALHRKLHAHYR